MRSALVERFTVFDAIRSRASSTPDEVALVDDDRAITWAEVARQIERAAAALLAVAPGPAERVSVLGENRIPTLITHAAALGVGVGTIATSKQLTARELSDQYRDGDVVMMVAGAGSVDVARQVAGEMELRSVVVHGAEHPSGVTSWDSWLADAPALTDDADLRSARLPLVYTSGTTGRARGAEVRWVAGACDTARDLVADLTDQPAFPAGANLVVGPLQHNAPLTSVRHLLGGEPVIILGAFNANRVLELIETHRVTSSVWVPTHMQRLLALPAEVRARHDLSSLTLVNQTGSACPVSVKAAMIEWLGPIFVESYGGTETGTLCRITSAEWLVHRGSVGRPRPPLEVVVVDDDGEVVPAGQVGVLGFRGPEGWGPKYHADPEKTARAYVRPGVFTLGDVGYVDDDGYVFVVDRVADMVVSGGVNLYPVEAENVIAEHPDVAQVAVVGVPDADLGETQLALVVPVDAAHPPSASSLEAFARQRIAAYKVPRRYELRSNLDLNAMGKPDKRAMRVPYWPEVASPVDSVLKTEEHA